MGRKTGVTSMTPKRHILDAGVVYLNWGSKDPLKPQKVLGASRGGNTFTLETEWRDMPYDGIDGIVRGARRKVGSSVTLTVNLTEVYGEIMKYAWPGSKVEEVQADQTGNGVPITDEVYDKVTRLLEKTIPDFEYTDVAIVAEYSGTTLPALCIVRNAMASSNVELSFTDKEESVISITFTGTIDPDRPDIEAGEIWIPRKVQN